LECRPLVEREGESFIKRGGRRTFLELGDMVRPWIVELQRESHFTFPKV